MNPKLFWIGLVVGLLFVSLLIQGTALFFSLNDPSFAVVPGYEDKAARWDDHARQRELNDRLGWQVRVDTSPADSGREVAVLVTVTDADDRPIDGASVRVDTFHNARAGSVLSAPLGSRGDGRYGSTLPIRRAGIWEFRVEIERNGTRFTDTVRKTVATRRG